YSFSTDKPKRYPFSLSKKIMKLFIFTSLYLQRSVMPPVLLLLNRSLSPPPFSAENIRMFLWAEFRDPWFYPSSCESLPSIATIGGRSGCKAGYVPGGAEGRDDSPDMDVIGISDNFFSDINKPAAVNCIEGHDRNKVLKTSVSGLVELNILKNLTVYVVAGSLGRFKSHASNIVALKLMEAINSNHRTFTISTITEDTIIENHGKEHSENILPSSEGDVGLAASSGPSVLGDKVDEECAAADPPEISDAQNNRKRCRE
ncbi:hypothetical protein HID58_078095, partial [Brassica napus]